VWVITPNKTWTPSPFSLTAVAAGNFGQKRVQQMKLRTYFADPQELLFLEIFIGSAPMLDLREAPWFEQPNDEA
jgi:hypothetical protein